MTLTDEQKTRLYNAVANDLVACYGFLWAIEKSIPTIGGTVAKTLIPGLLLGPWGLAAAGLYTAGKAYTSANKSSEYDKDLQHTMEHIIRLAKMLYPNEDVKEATLLVVAEVSIVFGETRIYNELVDKTRFGSNGWGGNVLVRDACNMVTPKLEEYFDKKTKNPSLAK